ncbi:coniferyl-alcohol dehydrogenase [Rhodococcus sp. USK13]|uniref:coniferyl-alcohol dehydrogenase n=1 Tax=Rhodococcus sp. USK13 TaxID=2806442 RepID=UPI001BCF6F82|nr:coniferyl-alcohol dehydrogenase [Rhodococcus sp. USK13]
MTDWTGKRIIITGAASGIGASTAQILTAAGARVYSLDRNEPTVEVTGHIAVDLADEASIDSAVEQLDGEFDALLNVAGVPGTAPAEVVFSVNSLAVRHLTEALMGRLVSGASIVVVSSTAGFGWPSRLDAIKEVLATETFGEGLQWFKENPQEGNAYNFSKEVSTVYTMMMGLGLAGQGLRINAILPGPVDTPILSDFEQTMGKDTLDGVRDLVGRHAVPIDIARAIVFLASEEAGWINGHALAVDGGISGALATDLFPQPEI